jgi:flavin-dependent dehydrogenase
LATAQSSQSKAKPRKEPITLEEGARVGVVGGGPAGSLFAYFLLQMAGRIGFNLSVDVYDRKDFCLSGPAGCNMCGGVVSESLVQALSIEGIDLPGDVVQRGIDSFIFHSAEETVTLAAPYHEMRIATVYRGAGPKGNKSPTLKSFDNYLLGLAAQQGAKIIREKITDVTWDQGRPRLHWGSDQGQTYDLVAGAIGVKMPNPELFDKLGTEYRKPGTRRTSNCEYEFGSDFINAKLGNSMHAFLLDLPSLDFAALIPKGEHVTMCLIGDKINSEFVADFVKNPAVNNLLPENIENSGAICKCSPQATLCNGRHPYGDRLVMLGDCGVARLNKDGIGSAYRVAKTAAVTALFRGISAKDFKRGYAPLCRKIDADNRYGRIVFDVVDVIKKSRFLTRAVMRMARSEANKSPKQRRMSRLLWDMFTGSAPYREAFYSCFHPGFWGRLMSCAFVNPPAIKAASAPLALEEEHMDSTGLGKDYRAGEVIVRQGEIGDSMYVIQSGQAEVIQSKDGKEVRLATLGEKDIFGEMALFHKEARSATVRALTNVRALTVDRHIFLRRVHEDPSFVFGVLSKMSQRIRNLDSELTRLKAECGESSSAPK